MVSLNVLVVDDSELTIRKISKSLQDLGHEVVATASTGKEAIETYQNHNPDLVTLDITMPEMDGISAVKEIVAKFPDANILMVTSHNMANLVLEALRSGAKGYVLKPVDTEALEKEIKNIIDVPA